VAVGREAVGVGLGAGSVGAGGTTVSVGVGSGTGAGWQAVSASRRLMVVRMMIFHFERAITHTAYGLGCPCCRISSIS